MKKNFTKNSKGNKMKSRNKSKTRSGGKYDPDIRDAELNGEGKEPSRSSQRKDRGNNDVNWYFSSSEQLRNVASYPFSNALMKDISVDVNGESIINSLTPGICRIDLVPTIGSDYKLNDNTSSMQLNGSDAINVAAKSLYSYIRHANSGHTNYDSPDLMMYLLAMDSLYMLYSHLVRMYGVINLFQYNNRWYPDKLLQSMGIKNPEYLRAHAADFRAMINNFGIRLSSFAVPTVMPYFHRHLWLYQNIFLDRQGSKAQSYYFHPATFYTLEEKTSSGAGKLVPYAMENFITNNPIDELTAYINKLLSPIVESEDIGIMSGDILKAYGPDKLFAFTPIPEFYVVLPMYHEGVLPEIHNLTQVSKYSPTNYTGLPVGEISQSPDGFIYQEMSSSVCGDLEHSTDYMNGNPFREWMIELPYDSISPEDFVYATRLVTLRDLSSGTGVKHSPITGSEMVVGLNIVDWAGWDGNHPSLTPIRQMEQQSAITVGTLQSTAFDWFPRIYLYTLGSNASDTRQIVKSAQAIEDINNFTVINGRDLKKLNHSIMFNMFGVPQSLTNA